LRLLCSIAVIDTPSLIASLGGGATCQKENLEMQKNSIGNACGWRLNAALLDGGNGVAAAAPTSARLLDGVPRGAPGQGRFWTCAVRDGIQVPLGGEVAWVMPDGIKPYYRGKLTSLSYEYVNPR
jgi:hypothetical protein